VVAGWQCSIPNVDAFKVLACKLHCTTKALKSWSAKYIGRVHLQLAVAKEVVSQLDRQQERHQLSPQELTLRKELKMKCLGLASLQCTIYRQRSRIQFLTKGDANTRFFHLQACHRGRKNWIKKLQHEGSWFVDEEAKSQLIFDHFNSILGDYEQRNHRLDFNFLGLPTENLSAIDHCFSEEEVWAVIRELPPDKVPGPDRFIALCLSNRLAYN
jgi:hypothetical protein